MTVAVAELVDTEAEVPDGGVRFDAEGAERLKASDCCTRLRSRHFEQRRNYQINQERAEATWISFCWQPEAVRPYKVGCLRGVEGGTARATFPSAPRVRCLRWVLWLPSLRQQWYC